MKKIFRLFSVLIFFTSAIALPGCQSAKSSTASKMLHFNFEKGKAYDYEMIINMDQEIGGNKSQIDVTSYYSMDVTDDDGATKTLTTTYERLKMNMSLMGFNIEVDTDKPLPDFNTGDEKEKGMKMLSAVMGAIRGQKFQMKVNNEGKILEVTGFNDMANRLADSMDLDENAKQEMIKGFSQQFNDQNVRDQFERMLYIFPNKEVKVGDTWQKTSTPAGPMAGTYNSTYTVTEIEGDMVTLSEKSEISSKTEGMDMKGTGTGTMVIDSRSGLIVSGDQDLTLTAGKGDMNMEMKTKSRIKGKAR